MGAIEMTKISLNYGEYYHIYNRGNNKEALFKEDRNYHYFVDLYSKYVYPIADLYAYCLLPTHFHFLLRIKDLEDIEDSYQTEGHIWRQVRTFLGTYSKAINKAYHRSGHLFEGRYSRKIVQQDDYFFQLIIYIHQNPQKHGIVSDFRIWPFSSYQVYKRKDTRSIITKEVFSDYYLYNTIMDTHKKYVSLENNIDYG